MWSSAVSKGQSRFFMSNCSPLLLAGLLSLCLASPAAGQSPEAYCTDGTLDVNMDKDYFLDLVACYGITSLDPGWTACSVWNIGVPANN
jgi:hypothetical protein